MANNFYETASALKDDIIARRRDLHRHPELAFQEVRTAGIVASTLRDLGIEVQTGVGKTGVIGILEGEHEGPTVLVRADMDALPILEENEVDYISETPNVMHACGHDGHTSIALAVAQMLSEHRTNMHGRIKFVFQPAEEVGQGAQAMVDDGALNEPRPDYSVGLHLWNEMPLGFFSATPGPIMATCDFLDIKVSGYGGHAAKPHEVHDPIVAASHIVTALQSIVSRNVDPLEGAVVSITAVNGGDAYNVIPSVVTLKGTIRAFKGEIRDMLILRLNEICSGIASSLGCTAEIILYDRTEAVVNSADVSTRLTEIALQTPGITHINNDYRTMGAEDVGMFMGDVPGCFFFVGSANAEKGLDYPHHHPRFDFDEQALIIGASVLAQAAASYVLPES